jgi:hypothetical protein
MSIDPLRHLSVFQPHAFGQRRVDVIGVGATGSRIALSLAKLGIENIHAWDHDTVEEHNIPNQIFDQGDIGKLKVVALAEKIVAATGTAIVAHDERVDGSQKLGEIVFLLTDTMESRKEIWEKGLRLNIVTQLMVETRMDADNGRIYALNPNRLAHIDAWESTLYPSSEAPVSACGASVSVGPTAEIISGMAVWQLIRWAAIEAGGKGELDNEILFGVSPSILIAQKFKASAVQAVA